MNRQHLLAILIATLACFPSLRGAATELTLMSYNIRLDLASDGPDRWDARKAQLSAQVATLAPTILGIQEGLPQQVDYLEESLEGYTHIGVGRDDGIRKGEFSALYYRPAETKLLASSTFWLSETPEIPSYGWGAHYRRICTYGHFKDTRSQQTYWIFNTHFDHEVPEARLNGAKLILDRIAQLVAPHEPYFLMGDLNAPPNSPPIEFLSSRLNDARTHSISPAFGSEGTFNGFDTETPPSQRIDYLFASQNPAITITAYATHSDLIENRYPSDHFPIVARFQLHETAKAAHPISSGQR